MSKLYLNGAVICVRGAGDIATGVIQKFARCGFRVFALEIDQPTTIRRHIALSTAMQKGEMQVEDIRAKRTEASAGQMQKCWDEGIVPIIDDPAGTSILMIRPAAVIDAILAKRNLGTHRQMAPFTIALGPGFSAPEDVDIVIETMRGNQLGKLIEKGQALPDSGIPGEISGQGKLRVMHAPAEGRIKHFARIGDWLIEGQPVFQTAESVVSAPFDGMLRGLIAEGMDVKKGLKIADIDPRRLSREEVFGISDKARCIGGAALEAYLYLAASRRN